MPPVVPHGTSTSLRRPAGWVPGRRGGARGARPSSPCPCSASRAWSWGWRCSSLRPARWMDRGGSRGRAADASPSQRPPPASPRAGSRGSRGSGPPRSSSGRGGGAPSRRRAARRARHALRSVRPGGFYPLLVVPAALLAASARCLLPRRLRRRASRRALRCYVLLLPRLGGLDRVAAGPWSPGLRLQLLPRLLSRSALRRGAARARGPGWFRLETRCSGWRSLAAIAAAVCSRARAVRTAAPRAGRLVPLVVAGRGIAASWRSSAVRLRLPQHRRRGARGAAADGRRPRTRELIFPREKPPEEVERLRRDVRVPPLRSWAVLRRAATAGRGLRLPLPGGEAAAGRRGRDPVRQAVARRACTSTTPRSPTRR